MNELLRVRSLFIEFAGTRTVNQVVQNLDFTLHTGETLAIVGESGSGKSVSALGLLQLLNNKRSTVTGNAFLNYKGKECDLLDLPQHALQDLRGNAVSMIFQEPMSALNPVLTCGKQVAEVMLAHRSCRKSEVKKRVLQLFEEVELPRPADIYNSYPHQLSGGQQQRVMIAMALANNPVLLIADEPTTALDPEVQNSIITLIRKLQKKSSMAMIFISHDLDVVRQVADQIIVMQRGVVQEQGPAERILHSPQHPYTKGLLNSRPGRHLRGFRLPTVKDFMENPHFRPTQKPEKQLTGELILEAENITVAYHSSGWFKARSVVKAIDGVSLQLKKGETLGIIGPSGCGKTTTGRVLAGWIPPTSGLLKFEGKTAISTQEKPGKKWARKVQLIFQDPFGSLNPSITIGDAIAEPMLVHGMARSRRQAMTRVKDLLERTGLHPDHYNRYPHEFSGGQRQRIVIARALAAEPQVLVCDESVAALDVSVQSQVLNLLNDLQQELGLSYIFISHDHHVIEYFCDRILEMSAGKVVCERIPAEEPEKPASVSEHEMVEVIAAQGPSAVVPPPDVEKEDSFVAGNLDAGKNEETEAIVASGPEVLAEDMLRYPFDPEGTMEPPTLQEGDAPTENELIELIVASGPVDNIPAEVAPTAEPPTENELTALIVSQGPSEEPSPGNEKKEDTPGENEQQYRSLADFIKKHRRT